LSKKNYTYSLEWSSSRWFQQLQTDFRHFHYSQSDHSLSRRKLLTLLHVADVAATGLRGRRRRKHACSVASRRPSDCIQQREVRWSLVRRRSRRNATSGTDRRSATFEMPTARADAAGEQSFKTSGQLSVGEVAPHVPTVAERAEHDHAEIRSHFIDYRRQPERSDHRTPTAWKFYPTASLTPHSWLRKQATRTRRGRKPLVLCSIVDVRLPVSPTSNIEIGAMAAR